MNRKRTQSPWQLQISAVYGGCPEHTLTTRSHGVLMLFTVADHVVRILMGAALRSRNVGLTCARPKRGVCRVRGVLALSFPVEWVSGWRSDFWCCWLEVPRASLFNLVLAGRESLSTSNQSTRYRDYKPKLRRTRVKRPRRRGCLFTELVLFGIPQMCHQVL